MREANNSVRYFPSKSSGIRSRNVVSDTRKPAPAVPYGTNDSREPVIVVPHGTYDTGKRVTNVLHRTKESVIAVPHRINDSTSEVDDDASNEDASDAESDTSNVEAEEHAFRKRIANIPLSQVQKIKDHLGLKLFNKAYFGEDSAQTKVSSQKIIPKRGSAKKPCEVSSKRFVSKFRNVYQNQRIEKEKMDPRFNEQCGDFNEHHYKTNYKFIDQIQQMEKKAMISELKKNKSNDDPEKTKRLKNMIKIIDNKERSQREMDRRKEVIREIRQENQERMRHGLKPIFKTRGEVKRIILEKKYNELKKEGKIDKYMERKAKKNNRR